MAITNGAAAVTRHLKRVTPEGYLPATDWARREGLDPKNVSNYVQYNSVPHVKRGSYYFIPEGYANVPR